MSLSAPGSLVVTLLHAAGAHTHLRIRAFPVCTASQLCRLCSDMCMFDFAQSVTHCQPGSDRQYILCMSKYNIKKNKRAQAGRLMRKPVSVDAPALFHCPCAGFPGQWCVSLTHAHARARESGKATMILDRSRYWQRTLARWTAAWHAQ